MELECTGKPAIYVIGQPITGGNPIKRTSLLILAVFKAHSVAFLEGHSYVGLLHIHSCLPWSFWHPLSFV